MIEILDGCPYVRPCNHIPPDGSEKQDWSTPAAEMHERLTTLLPLAGGEVLPPVRPGGEPLIAALLRQEAPWMGAAIDLIAEQAAMNLWAGQPWLALKPTLLVGSPGAGKSHFARRLSELSGCGDAILSFAGTNSNSEIGGNPRGFKHPKVCFPAATMERTGTANPIVVIDEVEKASVSNIGDPVATLLTLMEPSTARRYFDGYLAAEINLSHVSWILTANSMAHLPPPLLSRVTVVEVSGPGPEHADQVLATLWQATAAKAGLPLSAMPPIEAEAEVELLRLFRRTRSVRRLRRAVEALVAVSVRHQPRTLN